MPVKLQVTKEGAGDGEPADYLFEQDRITIGRGSNNDLTLPDQKVSKEHAEIRSDEGNYHLYDRDSKNKTYVDGTRVGESEPYILQSGDVFQVGDFKIEFAPLFMPSSETTAYADEEDDGNPFGQYAKQLATALEGLAETYKFVPSEQREGAFAEAMQEHVDSDLENEEAVREVLRALGGGAQPTADRSAEGDAQHGPSSAPENEAISSVLETLLASVGRMISIPSHFWREFTGESLDRPDEKEVLHEADAAELRRHLLGDHVSQRERNERLEHLSEAVDSLVAHNMAMLAGYKKSVMAGSKELLQRVNPIDAVEEAEGDGGMMDTFFGGAKKSELKKLNEEWKQLFHGEWGTLESELFRPTYIDAYVDRMAKTWDMDKAEIVGDEDTG